MTDLEEGSDLSLDWAKLSKVAQCGEAVVPVCVQDAATREVLIVAYANERALREARRCRHCVLWSTSRGQLWVKGATSGDYLDLVQIRVNCEQNSLLYLVRPRRTGACHTKDENGNTRPSCYYRRLPFDNDDLLFCTRRPPARRDWTLAIVAFVLGVLIARR